MRPKTTTSKREQRVINARRVLRYYYDINHNNDVLDNIISLLADIRHLCDHYNIPFTGVLNTSHGQYTEERLEHGANKRQQSNHRD